MATPTIENYAKRIHLLGEKAPGEPVALGGLAVALGVTAGTVTTMTKSMAEAGLVEYQSRKGVILTESGSRLALRVLRRHRLIELYLVEQLGMDWADVHEEAEELEHSVSDRVLERMSAKLGDPRIDPHGAPIPGPDGKFDDLDPGSPLAEFTPPQKVAITQIRQQSGEFLEFLGKHSIRPGEKFEVKHSDPDAQTVTLARKGTAPVVLSLQAAQGIRAVALRK